ncbi:MAG: hypothetical protein ACI9UQ_002656, partial [Candidatus Krumholzibacteriia bacterium]
GAVAGAMLVFCGLSASLAIEPLTPYEKSNHLETPSYAETMTWLADLAADSSVLKMGSFGTSPQGRDLPLIIADAGGRFLPADHMGRSDRVVVLVQACIHGGESCGKDAGMMLLRNIAANDPSVAGILEKVTLLFIPILNVDGHERFGPYNRINQNGPREMGWRTNAQNLNLNRDYLKADLLETQSWLDLFDAWLPDFFIDIHSTDGADYQYPITYHLELFGGMDAGLTELTTKYRDSMVTKMEADGYPLGPYVSFRTWHDPASGLKAAPSTPRFSTGYMALQNRPGLLVETHMLKPYQVRVDSALKLTTHSLFWCGDNATELRNSVLKADEMAASQIFRAEPYPLTWISDGDSTSFEFLGVEYDSLTSETTGGQWIKFSERKSKSVVPFFDSVEPDDSADLPEAYLIPPEWSDALARLERHHIDFTRLTVPAEVTVRTWKFSNTQWQSKPYEGRHPVTFDATPITETRQFPIGTAVISLNQRSARVIAHLLEPKAPDSLLYWGFFSPIFTQTEYVESYVIESMIPTLLADNPEWATELAALKASNPDFAADPWAIRYWIYAKTPYFDSRVNIYPVASIDEIDQLEQLTHQ